MITEHRMPNTAQMANRMHRIAKVVVTQVDRAAANLDDTHATGRAAVAMGMWEILTGMDNTAEAMEYARRVSDPNWPGWWLMSDNAVNR